MKTKEIKRYNLPNDRTILAHIDAKPYGLLVIVIGIALYIAIKNQWLYGGGLALVGVLIFLLMPNRLLMEFTETYMILYKKVNSADCIIVYYDDVVSWKYTIGFREDELTINLVDGSTQKVEAFSKWMYESRMNQFLKDKKEKK